MTTLRKFFAKKEYANHKVMNVAGYVKDGKLHYIESDNPRLPAAVALLESREAKNFPIFTNLPAEHWLMTYKSRKGRTPYLLKSGDFNLPKHKGVYNPDVTLQDVSSEIAIKTPFKARAVAPPLSGGLYAAAKAVADRGKPTAPDEDRSPEEKVLRYYMLATFALLSLCKEFSYKGLGNYVAAMMVGDDGSIISAGVNTGSFRHAEVTMLMNYFAKNPKAKSIPEQTVVFSTLCPCGQCSKYLEDSRAVESVIYFSQMDTGPTGKAGAEGGKALEFGQVTKAARGVIDAGLAAAAPPSTSGLKKIGIADILGTCIDSSKPNIAGQLGNLPDALKTMDSAVTALENKVAKERGDGAEAQIKQKVLLYLAEWLITVELTE